jgi:hypothetical protein
MAAVLTPLLSQTRPTDQKGGSKVCQWKKTDIFFIGLLLSGCPVAIKTEQLERKIANKIGTGFLLLS